jgi:uncharacterized protein YjaZ
LYSVEGGSILKSRLRRSNFLSGTSVYRDGDSMKTKRSIRIHSVVFFAVMIGFFALFLNSTELRKLYKPSKIVSFMPDFFAFWNEAKDLPLEEKMRLWEEMFEAKHSDFYREAIYRGSEDEAIKRFKEQKLKNFLGSLKDESVQRMKIRERELLKLIPVVAEKVEEVLSSSEEATTHFIIPSLNLTSGAGAPYKGDLIIFFGIEFMIRYDNLEYIKKMIAHQILHVIHYRKLAPVLWKKYGTSGDLNVLLDREGPLFSSFREGLAIAFAEDLFPGGDRPGILEKNVPAFEKNFREYTKKFLQDLRDFTPEVFESYFSGTQKKSEPPGFGFFLGYKIVKSLLQYNSLEELIQWSPERAVQAVWKETQKIIENEVRLRAAREELLQIQNLVDKAHIPCGVYPS